MVPAVFAGRSGPTAFQRRRESRQWPSGAIDGREEASGRRADTRNRRSTQAQDRRARRIEDGNLCVLADPKETAEVRVARAAPAPTQIESLRTGPDTPGSTPIRIRHRSAPRWKKAAKAARKAPPRGGAQERGRHRGAQDLREAAASLRAVRRRAEPPAAAALFFRCISRASGACRPPPRAARDHDAAAPSLKEEELLRADARRGLRAGPRARTSCNVARRAARTCSRASPR